MKTGSINISGRTGISINGFPIIDTDDFKAKDRLSSDSSVRMMVLRHLLNNIHVVDSEGCLYVNIKDIIEQYGGKKSHGEQDVLCTTINRKYEKYLKEWNGSSYKIKARKLNASRTKQFDFEILKG